MAKDWCVLLPERSSTILKPTSWTAKFVRGMYAVRVKGRIPEDVEAELESRGIKYRPRDQTDLD